MALNKVGRKASAANVNGNGSGATKVSDGRYRAPLSGAAGIGGAVGIQPVQRPLQERNTATVKKVSGSCSGVVGCKRDETTGNKSVDQSIRRVEPSSVKSSSSSSTTAVLHCGTTTVSTTVVQNGTTAAVENETVLQTSHEGSAQSIQNGCTAPTCTAAAGVPATVARSSRAASVCDSSDCSSITSGVKSDRQIVAPIKIGEHTTDAVQILMAKVLISRKQASIQQPSSIGRTSSSSSTTSAAIPSTQQISRTASSSSTTSSVISSAHHSGRTATASSITSSLSLPVPQNINIGTTASAIPTIQQNGKAGSSNAVLSSAVSSALFGAAAAVSRPSSCRVRAAIPRSVENLANVRQNKSSMPVSQTRSSPESNGVDSSLKLAGKLTSVSRSKGDTGVASGTSQKRSDALCVDTSVRLRNSPPGNSSNTTVRNVPGKTLASTSKVSGIAKLQPKSAIPAQAKCVASTKKSKSPVFGTAGSEKRSAVNTSTSSDIVDNVDAVNGNTEHLMCYREESQNLESNVHRNHFNDVMKTLIKIDNIKNDSNDINSPGLSYASNKDCETNNVVDLPEQKSVAEDSMSIASEDFTTESSIYLDFDPEDTDCPEYLDFSPAVLRSLAQDLDAGCGTGESDLGSRYNGMVFCDSRMGNISNMSASDIFASCEDLCGSLEDIGIGTLDEIATVSRDLNALSTSEDATDKDVSHLQVDRIVDAKLSSNSVSLSEGNATETKTPISDVNVNLDMNIENDVKDLRTTEEITCCNSYSGKYLSGECVSSLSANIFSSNESSSESVSSSGMISSTSSLDTVIMSRLESTRLSTGSVFEYEEEGDDCGKGDNSLSEVRVEKEEIASNGNVSSELNNTVTEDESIPLSDELKDVDIASSMLSAVSQDVELRRCLVNDNQAEVVSSTAGKEAEITIVENNLHAVDVAALNDFNRQVKTTVDQSTTELGTDSKRNHSANQSLVSESESIMTVNENDSWNLSTDLSSVGDQLTTGEAMAAPILSKSLSSACTSINDNDTCSSVTLARDTTIQGANLKVMRSVPIIEEKTGTESLAKLSDETASKKPMPSIEASKSERRENVPMAGTSRDVAPFIATNGQVNELSSSKKQPQAESLQQKSAAQRPSGVLVMPVMDSLSAIEDLRTELLITQAKSLLSSRDPGLLSSASGSPLDVLLQVAQSGLPPISKSSSSSVSSSSVCREKGDSGSAASPVLSVFKSRPIAIADFFPACSVADQSGAHRQPKGEQSCTFDADQNRSPAVDTKSDVAKDANQNVVVIVSQSPSTTSLPSAVAVSNAASVHHTDSGTDNPKTNTAARVNLCKSATNVSAALPSRTESIRQATNELFGTITAQIEFARSCSRVPTSRSSLAINRPRSENFQSFNACGSTDSVASASAVLSSAPDAALSRLSRRRRPSPRSLYNLNDSSLSGGTTRITSGLVMSGSAASFANWMSPSCVTPTPSSLTSSPCTTPTVSNPPSLVGSAAGLYPSQASFLGHSRHARGVNVTNRDDDLHSSVGSFSSLISASSSCSTYSTIEEMQAHEIQKLKQELEVANEKISTLTTQLSVSALFEQSLERMTQKCKQLTNMIDQKDAELAAVRRRSISNDVDLHSLPDGPHYVSVRRQSSNASSTLPGDMRRFAAGDNPQYLSRHISYESVTSLNSQSSSCSVASQQSATVNGMTCSSSLVSSGGDKKKKKKNWIKNSFAKAFSKRKNKNEAMIVDEQDTVSLRSELSIMDSVGEGSAAAADYFPSSAKHSPHGSGGDRGEGSFHDESSLPHRPVVELEQELREKDNAVTELRLDALSSLSHVEQLQETISRLEAEVQSLKSENKNLKHLNRLLARRDTNSAMKQTGVTVEQENTLLRRQANETAIDDIIPAFKTTANFQQRFSLHGASSGSEVVDGANDISVKSKSCDFTSKASTASKTVTRRQTISIPLTTVPVIRGDSNDSNKTPQPDDTLTLDENEDIDREEPKTLMPATPVMGALKILRHPGASIESSISSNIQVGSDKQKNMSDNNVTVLPATAPHIYNGVSGFIASNGSCVKDCSRSFSDNATVQLNRASLHSVV